MTTYGIFVPAQVRLNRYQDKLPPDKTPDINPSRKTNSIRRIISVLFQCKISLGVMPLGSPTNMGVFERRQEELCLRFIPTIISFSFHTISNGLSGRHHANERPIRNDFVTFSNHTSIV